MDKKFIENCKLLKKHFTELTQADTTARSDRKLPNSSAAKDIIAEAKTILLYEQLEALSDKDIQKIRQKSLLNYAKALRDIESEDKFKKKLCHKNCVKWNDDLFFGDVPNPKHGSKYLPPQLKPIRAQNENKENNKLQRDILQNYDLLLSLQKNAKFTNAKGMDNLETELGNFGGETINVDSARNWADKYVIQGSGTQIAVNDYGVDKNAQKKITTAEKSDVNCSEIDITLKKFQEENTDSVNYASDKMTAKATRPKVSWAEKRSVICLENNSENVHAANLGTNLPITNSEIVMNEGFKTKVDRPEKTFIVPKEDNNFESTARKSEGSKEPKKNKTTNNEVMKELTEIPELKITTPQNTKVETLLDVKKIKISTNAETENFDSQEEKLLENSSQKKSVTLKTNKENKKRPQKPEGKNKIEIFLDSLQRHKLSNVEKSKSDLVSNNQKELTTKAKPKSCSILENKVTSYEFRFKAQKEIIQMQKVKLDEQNQLIEALKLGQLEKEARESLKKAQTDLKTTISGSSKHKYKAKSLETQQSETNDPLGVSLSLSLTKAPKLVLQMEERAKEREERRILIKERKRIIEEEKKKQVEEAIHRKLQEETEEKQKRLEKMQKQRELVRQLEYKKQLEKKRFITINQMAYAFYKKILQRSGMRRFKMLIYNVRIKTEIAKRFYENNIVLLHFKIWKDVTNKIVTRKKYNADEHYKRTLLKEILSKWKIVQFEAKQSRQVAVDRYEMSLQSHVFVAWHRLVCEYHIQYTTNCLKADKHYRRILLFQCLHCWRSLPALMQIERTQNERKRKWRLRVAEILVDYDPLKNYDT